MRGEPLDLNEETLGEMAGEIAKLLHGRSDLPEASVLSTHVETLTTKTETLVQVIVSDISGKAVLSVSVALRAPQTSPPQLTLINRVHH